jgi:Cupin domain
MSWIMQRVLRALHDVALGFAWLDGATPSIRIYWNRLALNQRAELIYVLSGKLAVRVDEEETILSAGDSMYFDSGAPHSYRA